VGGADFQGALDRSTQPLRESGGRRDIDPDSLIRALQTKRSRGNQDHEFSRIRRLERVSSLMNRMWRLVFIH